jgi:tight adherence protein B
VGNLLIVAFVTAAAVMLLIVGVYATIERTDDVADRVQAYAALQDKIKGGDDERQGGKLLRRLDRLISGRSVAQKLTLRLAQANIRMTVPEFLAIVAGAGMLGGALGFAVRGQGISAIGGAGLGLAAPWVYLDRRRQSRINKFHVQLLDVLALVVGALRGGHALLTALDLISKELDAPASEEFERVLREISYGLSQTEALNNLVARMETDDLQLVVTAVNISHEVGGNLSMVLEKIANTLRERIQLQGEIRVLTTQQRMTTYLLTALPPGLALILFVISPTWMAGLFKPGWPRLIPIGAGISEMIGFVLAQRMAKIEV